MPEKPATTAFPLHILDYVFLMRPAAMVPLWVFFLVGARAGSDSAGGASRAWLTPGPAILGLAAASAILGGGYVLNQIRDIETDRANRKLFLLPDGLVSLRAAWIELAAVWLAGCVIAVFLPVGFRILTGVALVVNLTYSAGPVPAKSRFPLDLIWNGLGFGLMAFAAGWATCAPMSARAFLAGLPYGMAVAGVIASTTIPDEKGDRLLGLRTSVVALGERGTSVLSICLLGAAAVSGLLLREPVAVLGSFLSMPLLVRAHVTRARRDRVLADQAAVGGFALVASFRAPLILLLIATAYLASRAYYGARFDLTYPEIGPRAGSKRPS
jgi:4-hydroxybenzoate polyprenyltransferase